MLRALAERGVVSFLKIKTVMKAHNVRIDCILLAEIQYRPSGRTRGLVLFATRGREEAKNMTVVAAPIAFAARSRKTALLSKWVAQMRSGRLSARMSPWRGLGRWLVALGITTLGSALHQRHVTLGQRTFTDLHVKAYYRQSASAGASCFSLPTDEIPISRFPAGKRRGISENLWDAHGVHQLKLHISQIRAEWADGEVLASRRSGQAWRKHRKSGQDSVPFSGGIPICN